MEIKHNLKYNQYYQLNITPFRPLFVPYIHLKTFEIGGGKGVLTRLFKHIDVCEINSQFRQILSTYAKEVYGDFFNMSIDELNSYELIVGNLPYKLTSKILNKLKTCTVKTYIFLIQKQFAEKLVCDSLSSLKVNMCNMYNIEYMSTVDRKYFTPIPAVNGAFIKLTKKQCTYDESKLKQVCKIFLYPRKKLAKIYKLINQFNLTLYTEKRASELCMSEFDNIYRLWQ